MPSDYEVPQRKRRTFTLKNRYEQHAELVRSLLAKQDENAEFQLTTGERKVPTTMQVPRLRIGWLRLGTKTVDSPIGIPAKDELLVNLQLRAISAGIRRHAALEGRAPRWGLVPHYTDRHSGTQYLHINNPRAVKDAATSNILDPDKIRWHIPVSSGEKATAYNQQIFGLSRDLAMRLVRDALEAHEKEQHDVTVVHFNYNQAPHDETAPARMLDLDGKQMALNQEKLEAFIKERMPQAMQRDAEIKFYRDGSAHARRTVAIVRTRTPLQKQRAIRA